MQYAEAQPEGHLPGTEKKKRLYPYGSAVLLYLPDSQKKKHPGQRIHRKFIVIFTAVEKKKDSVDQIEKHFRKIVLWIPTAKAKPVHQRTGKENTEGTYHRDRKNRIFSKRIRDMKMPKIPMETRKSLSKSEMLIWAPMITAKTDQQNVGIT